MDRRLADLERWTRERYPRLTAVDYRWSARSWSRSTSFISGRNPGSRHIYAHTGDSGQGITNGVAGSLTILPLIIGEDSRYAGVLDPRRKSLTSTTSVWEFARGQFEVVKNLTEHLGRRRSARLTKSHPAKAP
jgi:glycine/D-amino acid oxidase-like deaminating enzyme